jgi:DNA polymerase-4
VVEVLGWDEAFLGVETEDPEAVAKKIQLRVREATGLDCSVGIGKNKLQAKIATNFGKPAGMFRLTSDNWFPLLGDRPTDALWGIGRKTAAKLEAAGVRTVTDLAAADPQVLAGVFGPTIGPWLVQVGQGRDSSSVVGDPWVARSRSREVTFQRNLENWDDVRREVLAIAARVHADVVAEGRRALRVVVKVRHAPFFTSTHGHTLTAPSSDRADIEAAALAALDRFDDHRPVRLLGVRADLAPAPRRPPPG